MEVAQTPRKHCIGQRSMVCGGNNEGAKPLIGNPNKTLDSLSPSNRQPNRKDNPEVGIVSKGLYDHKQEQWPDQLGIAEFTYNNKIHVATKILPFKANYG